MSDNKDPIERAEQLRRQKLVKAAGAVGIGSAALVAALLYASTIRKKPKA